MRGFSHHTEQLFPTWDHVSSAHYFSSPVPPRPSHMLVRGHTPSELNCKSAQPGGQTWDEGTILEAEVFGCHPTQPTELCKLWHTDAVSMIKIAGRHATVSRVVFTKPQQPGGKTDNF
ncbi:hypothetical protein H1C71_036258 [Ictidomys tridecemlineatus]|nr:hypothetical protein H1C71_036258 [Ictidomys tridecemlineatus]